MFLPFSASRFSIDVNHYKVISLWPKNARVQETTQEAVDDLLVTVAQEEEVIVVDEVAAVVVAAEAVNAQVAMAVAVTTKKTITSKSMNPN